MIQEINEPVAVIVLFETGKVQPLRVKWGERVYRVRTVFNTWRQKLVQGHELHIAVATDSATEMELVIDLSDLSWRLARVSIDG